MTTWCISLRGSNETLSLSSKSRSIPLADCGLALKVFGGPSNSKTCDPGGGGGCGGGGCGGGG